MMQLPTVSWTFNGPPETSTRQEWPRWIVFMNFAFDDTRMVIHDWDGKHVVNRGDTVLLHSIGQITVVRA